MKIGDKKKKEMIKAVDADDLPKIQQLLKEGVPAEFKYDNGYILQMTPLLLACHGTSLEIVKLLVEHGADVNAKTVSESGGAGDRTPLSYATVSGKGGVPMVAFLLDKGAIPDVPDNWGGTAFSNVVSNNNIPVFDYFVARYGQGVMGLGKDLIAWAAKHEDTYMLDKLLGFGGSPDGNPSRSPLLVAASMGRKKVLEMLLAHGANPHVIDEEGRNAVFRLCGYVRSDCRAEDITQALQMAEILIAKGVDLSHPSERGITALDHANLAEFPDLAVLLKKHGAKYGTLTKPKKRHKKS